MSDKSTKGRLGPETLSPKNGAAGSFVTIVVSCMLSACGAEESSEKAPTTTPNSTIDCSKQDLLTTLKQQGRVTKREAMIGGICN